MSPASDDQTWVQPRRRPNAVPSLSSPVEASSESPHASTSKSSPKMRLIKGETFHSPSSPPSEDRDPVLSFRSLPHRSPTCPKDLDAIAAGEQRMADILGRLSLNSDDPVKSKPSLRVDDDLPVPSGILQAHMQVAPVTGEPPSSSDSSPRPLHKRSSLSTESSSPLHHSHSHSSDSGLGTSISSQSSISSDKNKVRSGQLPCAQQTQSAITSSISAVDPKRETRQLGTAACKQIERFILVPILKEERLKPFHPLVHSIPRRIADKEIVCLRDLEKTLLWLAPYSAAGRKSYLRFCEVTVQCIHTSVPHLNDRDQRLPADRPYTNGYFLDLVAQIRQYAAMISSSRDRIQPGGKPKQSDPFKGHHLTLEGGLSQTGRPAELVARKDGKAISMRTGKTYEPDATQAFKRTLSLDSVDEGATRSMARRKKDAPPMNINKKCTDCDKIFKRPCDLTKHEKTHTRPYKCTYESCKYHVKGWPTEKERDRHINDKHSNTPKLYRCEYADCGYQSKRESNCKQHMEKTHGWVYVRSRNNGKQPQDRASAQPTVPTPPTPVLSTPPSVMGDFSTPTTGPSPTTALSVSPYALQTGFDTCQGFSFGDTPFPATTEEVMTDNSLRASPFMPTGGGDFLLYSDNQQSQPSQTMYPGSTPQGLTETQNAMFPTGMNNLMDNGVTTGMESGMNLSAPVGVGNLMLPTAMDNFAQTGGDNLFDGMQPPAPPGEVDEFQVFSEQFWSQMADAAALDGMNYGNVPC